MAGPAPIAVSRITGAGVPGACRGGKAGMRELSERFRDKGGEIYLPAAE